MSVKSQKASRRPPDRRVVRTRAAVMDAARTLFLRQGYAGTTMEEIAAEAGLTKRTVYNNYGDKDALFVQIVEDVLGYAESFARELDASFDVGVSADALPGVLDELAQRMALTIVRPEVIALRRMLIGEARSFPLLAAEYFDRAPGAVMDVLASKLAHLARRRLLRVPHPRRAAAQFAYLVAGEALDRAMLVGTVPAKGHLTEAARDGVETFLARFSR